MSQSVSVSKEFSFSYAHCIPGHPKCGRLHGHNAKVIVTVSHSDVSTRIFDNRGMYIDFSLISDIFKTTIHKWFDHRFLLGDSQPGLIPELTALRPGYRALLGLSEESIYSLGFPSTAENLASFILDVFQTRLVGHPFDSITVEFFETPTSSAIVSWVKEVIP